MGPGKVADMDVIPDAGSVRSGIVIAEYFDFLAFAGRNFENERNQMGFRVVVFADLALRVCSGSVEIA